ncbi:MAG: polyribonucleotide nucleotidyltransferase [Eubacteriaceae bacterium]|nr:polyribonucleotide nucleotidyltransferase [Eubacteriaceae bacterium]
MKQTFKTDFAGRPFVVETGELARLANGSALVSYGDTSVLITACMSKEPKPGLDYFPLSINYEEKLYAVGRIPGGFLRREGRASDKATLSARLIDRPLRPMFDKGFRNDVQVVATVVSVEYDNLPEITALNGASLALCISDIPFDGPVGGVNMGLVNGELVVNPTSEQRAVSDLNLTVAGTEEAVLMVEAGANIVSEDIMIKAILKAHEEIKKIVAFQKDIIAQIGKAKADIPYHRPDEAIYDVIHDEAYELFTEVLKETDKIARDAKTEAAQKALVEKYSEQFPEGASDIIEISEKILKEIVRKKISEDGVRPDGRTLTEIRPITCEVGKLKRVHGSGIFTRGLTQVMSVVTLGTLRDNQILDGLTEEDSKRYMHQYNFPPYSTDETGRIGSPGRREIGHGALAERALEPVIPSVEEFPYSIRVVSEVLSSNGSTSQASVCGSTLSLMDAGVPIKAPVAGIAMGLIKTDDKICVLSDIQGVEDFYGDMDFKVAGTAEGITAIQMDIKIHGINEEILTKALTQAREGRLFILGKMLACIDKPRAEVSEYAPRIITMHIPVDKIREVIGSGGKVINKIIEDTGVKIDIEDDGTVYIGSTDAAAGLKAQQIIEGIIKDIEVGEVFTGKVTRIMNIGAFVEMPNGREGLVHISKLDTKRVENVEDVVSIGDEIEVKVVEIDKQGRINLSRKALLPGGEDDRPERSENRRSSYSGNRNNNNRSGNNNKNRQ